ncbi:universal stress protein [Flagellimonas beolgyonensis]|jgi:nucleotide-binding universal stress UspA family protein|uniref:universal stress protein n=1 Tax=Flagellimonas beolgyonensis TaxID=864064 RepID=UPI000F8C4902|nr:universal stress protein [Allomuricauda beolgyonensis]
MSSVNKILVPFDFSEASLNALEYVANFVGPQRSVDILALYVSVMPISEGDLAKLKVDFEKVVDSIGVRLQRKPEFKTEIGDVTNTILKIQEQTGADLIMMGTMGDKVTDEAITNTSKLVLDANCSVISIPYGCPIKEPKNVALLLGREKIEDKEVLASLLDLARTFDSRIHVLTIYKESIYEEDAIVENTEELLEYYLEHFYADHTFNKNADVEAGILSYIEEKDIDLLVILPRNHVRKSTPSEGRLTKMLTLHSEIPVLALD